MALVTPRGSSLADRDAAVREDLLEAWREAAEDAALAYAAWRRVPSAQRREAHAVYVAAADREAVAAEALATRC